MRARAACALLAVLALAAFLPPAPAGAQATDGVAVEPYVDSAQLADQRSFRLQPWRGWMDTVPAARLLDGIGMQYRVPAGTDHGQVLGLLADAGIHRIRLEVPWNSMEFGTDQLSDFGRDRLDSILSAAEDNDIAPLLLLNANSSQPCPYLETTAVVAADASAGDDRVTLESVDGLVPGRSGISGVTEAMAGLLIVDVDDSTGEVTLGQPLLTDLEAGTSVTIDTLQFAPLHAVGTQEFEDTAAGWLTYVRAVLDEAREFDLPDLEVEIWNETAFASEFLDAANYDERATLEGEDKFRPGGRAWELAARTTAMVHDQFAGVRVYWGFSNSNFYATPVDDLPPGTDAVSYHPYGTGLLEVPQQFPDPEDVSAYDQVPSGIRLAVPEGRTALAVQPKPLVRQRLAPDRRDERPEGSDDFEQVVTEHGCTPSEAGITDAAFAMHHKARCLLRYVPFWLNKGIAELYMSRTWDADPLGRGLLSPDASPADGGVSDGDLESEATEALRHFVDAFDGAEAIERPRQLGVDVVALGPQHQVFAGDDGGPGLWDRDLLAVLPFQVTGTRFAVPVYVLTYDLTDPIDPQPFRLTFTGLDPTEAEVRWYDPLTDTDEAVSDVVKGTDSITVTVDVTDTARVLVIDEAPAPGGVVPGWAVPVGLVLLLVVGGGLLLWWLLSRSPAMAGPSPYPGTRRRGRGRGRPGRRRARPF